MRSSAVRPGAVPTTDTRRTHTVNRVSRHEADDEQDRDESNLRDGPHVEPPLKLQERPAGFRPAGPFAKHDRRHQYQRPERDVAETASTPSRDNVWSGINPFGSQVGD